MVVQDLCRDIIYTRPKARTKQPCLLPSDLEVTFSILGFSLLLVQLDYTSMCRTTVDVLQELFDRIGTSLGFALDLLRVSQLATQDPSQLKDYSLSRNEPTFSLSVFLTQPVMLASFALFWVK
jgi:hypothetical protein